MSSPPKLTLVTANGWEGLYADGVLAAQGNRVRPEEVIEAVGAEFDEFRCDQAWLNRLGWLPDRLDEVLPARREELDDG